MQRILCLACLAALLLVTTPSVAEEEAPTKESIEKDLALEITYAGPETIQPGEEIPVTWRLRNRSKTRTHKYVLPSDGSESAWREPYVYYSGERPDAASAWKPVKAPGTGGRCGLFDANWHDEIRSIAPGEIVELNNWLPLPDYAFDVQKAGRVRLRANYAYRAKEPEREVLDVKEPPRGLGDMGKIPPFHLVSNAIEFRIVRRFEIEAEVVGEIRLGEEQLLSELLALRVVNKTDETLELDPQNWDFALTNAVGAGTELNEGVQLSPEGLGKAAKRSLKPGASVPLTGADGLRPGRDIRLRFTGEPGAKVHARFVLIEGGGSRVRLASPYFELKVAR